MGLSQRLTRCLSWNGGRIKYPLAVNILRRIKHRNRAIQTTRGDNGNLPLERHKALQNHRHGVKLRVNIIGFGRISIFENLLALAVIAHAPRLQNAISTKYFQRAFKVINAADGQKRSCFNARLIEKILFHQPVLRRFQRLWAGAHGRQRIDKLRRRHRHIFKLVSDNITLLGKRR